MKSDQEPATVTFTTKGQVVIPSALRRKFEISEGTKATVTVTEEGILLRPITPAAVRRARGILAGKAGRKSFAEEWAEHKRKEKSLEDK